MPNRHSPPTRRDPSTLPCMAVAPATPAKQTIRKTTPHFAPFSPPSSFTFPRQKIIVNPNVRVNYISPPRETSVLRGPLGAFRWRIRAFFENNAA